MNGDHPVARSSRRTRGSTSALTVPKANPLGVFEENIADAEQLVHLARVLANTRRNRMRKERRTSIGAALGLPKKVHDQLDCVESDELFIVIKPGALGQRSLFTEDQLQPLLRQAIVATAAAVESFVADKACTYIGEALRGDDLPKRLAGMGVNFGQVIAVDREYTRRGWGYRHIVREHLEAQASSSPAQIGQVFSTVGHADVLRKVDGKRHVLKGTSNSQLEELTARRNRIAHTGDRTGSARAGITIADVATHLANAKSIVEALDAVLP